MRRFLKNWRNPLWVIVLVGLVLAGALLFLAAQKGETQGGKKPEEEMRPARLIVHYTRELTIDYGGRSREVEREALDATIVFEFPEGAYQVQEAACEGVETQRRQLEQELKKEQNEIAIRMMKQAIKEMEKAARECRQTIPTYGFQWDPDSGGSYSVPGPIRLVSFSGQASYFHKRNDETEQGSGTLGAQQPWSLFSVGLMGDKVTHLTVGGNLSITGTTPRQALLEATFPVIASTERGGSTTVRPQPDCSVQVTRTSNGYTGSASCRKTITEGGKTQVETKTMNFTFDIREATYEVVITPPKNLRDWLPKGGRDENTPGDTLKFTGQVQEKKDSKGGKAGGSRKVKVVFELTSSREPGIAMNFPSKDSGSKPPRPDLQILKEGTSGAFKITEETREDGLGEYKAEGEFKVGESFTLVVGSFDYGAYGYLNVSADAPVRIEDYPDTNRVWLPRDDNMNSIADEWEKDMGIEGMASDADEDSKPEGDGTPGDGLSLYEEYRGFMVQGNHIRTNPKYKDLFIFDLDKMGPGHFKKSGLRLHFVKLLEFDEDPASQTPNTAVINYNHGHSNLGKQHLLFLMDGDANGNSGYIPGDVGPPKDIKYVLIDLNVHKWSLKGELPATIAHELAHASNVGHHGTCDYTVEKVELQDPDGKWTTVSFGNTWIGTIGGQGSGAICIMKYTPEYYEKPNGRFRWEKEAGKGFRYGERYPRGEATGTIFCNTKRGSGVTGNATYGECKKQFCVNDARPCRKLPDVQCR